MATLTPYELSWTANQFDERRFRQVVAIFLIVFLIGSISVSYITVPKQERSQAEKLPPRLAKMILERKKIAPPPKPEIKIEKPEVKKEEPKKEPEKKKPEKKPEKEKVEKKEPPKPIKQKTPEQRVEAAREKAASSGLLAFSDDLADLRETPVFNSTAPLATGQPKSSSIERSMMTSMAEKSSGGISTSQRPLNTGGVQLTDRSTTAMESPIELAARDAVANKKSTKQVSKIKERSKGAVILKLSQNKGAIDSIYRRALRKDPTLQGRVNIEIVIAPSGKVIKCEIISSEFQSEEVLKKIRSRIKFINFGAENVSEFTIQYNFDFLPT